MKSKNKSKKGKELPLKFRNKFLFDKNNFGKLLQDNGADDLGTDEEDEKICKELYNGSFGPFCLIHGTTPINKALENQSDFAVFLMELVGLARCPDGCKLKVEIEWDILGPCFKYTFEKGKDGKEKKKVAAGTKVSGEISVRCVKEGA